MSSPVPDIASSSSAAITNPSQGRGGQGGQAERAGRAGRGRGGRDNQNGGCGIRAFYNNNSSSRIPKLRGSFQAMGGHVFELPEESNDRTQYSKTIDKLKESRQRTKRATWKWRVCSTT